MDSREVASWPRSKWMTVPLRESRFWLGICLILMGAPHIAYAWNSSTITVTNSAGQFSGVLNVAGGGIDASQGITCPTNASISMYQAQLAGLQFIDTHGDALPLNTTSAVVYYAG